MTTTTNLATTIDALGDVKAQIAELEAKEKDLKAALGELPPAAYEGDRYRLVVSVAERSNLDLKAVREKLSPQFIRAHTTTIEVRTLRVTPQAFAATNGQEGN